MLWTRTSADFIVVNALSADSSSSWNFSLTGIGCFIRTLEQLVGAALHVFRVVVQSTGERRHESVQLLADRLHACIEPLGLLAGRLFDGGPVLIDSGIDLLQSPLKDRDTAFQQQVLLHDRLRAQTLLIENHLKLRRSSARCRSPTRKSLLEVHLELDRRRLTLGLLESGSKTSPVSLHIHTGILQVLQEFGFQLRSLTTFKPDIESGLKHDVRIVRIRIGRFLIDGRLIGRAVCPDSGCCSSVATLTSFTTSTVLQPAEHGKR